MLISGWNPNIVIDKRGSTALMWAAGGGHLDIVKLLFKYVCIYVYTWVYMGVCLYACTRIYFCICMCMFMCACV